MRDGSRNGHNFPGLVGRGLGTLLGPNWPDLSPWGHLGLCPGWGMFPKTPWVYEVQPRWELKLNYTGGFQAFRGQSRPPPQFQCRCIQMWSLPATAVPTEAPRSHQLGFPGKRTWEWSGLVFLPQSSQGQASHPVLALSHPHTPRPQPWQRALMDSSVVYWADVRGGTVASSPVSMVTRVRPVHLLGAALDVN